MTKSNKKTTDQQTNKNTGVWTEISGIAYIIINTFSDRKSYSTSITRKNDDDTYAKEYVRIIPCQGCAAPCENGEHKIIGNLSFRDYTKKNGDEIRELCIYARQITPVEDNDDLPF